MAYKFRLETVLMLRRNLEELAQQKLARELAALDEQQLRLSELRRQRQEMISGFEEAKRRPMPAPVFAFQVENIFRKEQEIEAGLAMVEAAQVAVVKAREELAARVQDKKVMEKARERDYQKFLLVGLKKELNEADEQMALRFGRNGNFH